MGRKFPPREAELYKRCDEVLHYVWDPIGVASAPAARDEYHSYLPQVFSLVRDNADPGKLASFLASTAEHMGLPANSKRDDGVVELLLNWREWIWNNIAE
jgi:hypothetical protein